MYKNKRRLINRHVYTVHCRNANIIRKHATQHNKSSMSLCNIDINNNIVSSLSKSKKNRLLLINWNVDDLQIFFFSKRFTY